MDGTNSGIGAWTWLITMSSNIPWTYRDDGRHARQVCEGRLASQGSLHSTLSGSIIA